MARRRLPSRTSQSTRGGRDSGGFTLIELLITTAILPIIVGATALALTTTLYIQSSVGNRVGASGDAQSVSAVFYQDVQSAQMATIDPSSTQCGLGTQVIGLEWDPSSTSPGVFNTVVTYVEQTGSASTSLIRNVCLGGDLSTPVAQTLVASSIITSQTIATLPAGYLTSPSHAWTSTEGLSQIELSIDESGNTFTLVGTPMANTSSQGIS